MICEGCPLVKNLGTEEYASMISDPEARALACQLIKRMLGNNACTGISSEEDVDEQVIVIGCENEAGTRAEEVFDNVADRESFISIRDKA